MLKSDFHDFQFLSKLILPVLESDKETYADAIEQINEMLTNSNSSNKDIAIIQQHKGFAPIQLPVKKSYSSSNNKLDNSNFNRLSKIYIQNKNCELKEFIIYFSFGLICGVEIKEDLYNLDLSSLDYSNKCFEVIPQNKFLKRDIDLEGCFDEVPELIDFIDVEYLSEEYEINGIILYRIIAFDDYRCICVDDLNKIYKVNFKVPIIQILFKDLESFKNALMENNNLIFELFGEKIKNYGS